ncbi:hypothetical protein [Neobacillus cucumis]|uniref:hypothetical protein n=1 Tax=Neobacillus cucumis TaxID=1740721 RepID=UPI0019651BE7|nr:hypothetical protein [Neobacillus cucumis]MBM7652514.1 hypothetical protein [Neobacillus cucumis]
MKKKWLYSAALTGALVVGSIPLMGFSSVSAAQGKIQPNQITLESGGTSVPYKQMGDSPYHAPVDGIISGTQGCQPDLHEFDKSIAGSHIVFTAGIKEVLTKEDAANFENSGAQIFVEIKSNGQTVKELPFELHAMPDNGELKEVDDPNTGLPFWVSAVYLNGSRNFVDLPTGDYNYQFKVKDEKGRVLDVWTPKNHKFTIIDSSQTN